MVRRLPPAPLRKAPASATTFASSSIAAHCARSRPCALKAAEHVNRLRRKSHMGHDGNAAFGQEADCLAHALAALQLDGTAFGFLHHPGGVCGRPVAGFPRRSRKAYQPRSRTCFAPRITARPCMIIRSSGHGQGAFKAMHHHAEGNPPRAGSRHTCRQWLPCGA